LKSRLACLRFILQRSRDHQKTHRSSRKGRKGSGAPRLSHSPRD
jgi:hypothetical protein